MDEKLIEAVAMAICDTIEWDGSFSDFSRSARAALAAIEASGTHVVVPVEATQAMIDAAYDRGEISSGGSWPTLPAFAYAAMLSARPPIGGESNG